MTNKSHFAYILHARFFIHTVFTLNIYSDASDSKEQRICENIAILNHIRVIAMEI
jgi:hypothetical protein